MSKYYIHCCEKRYWYVMDYLIPSMLKQGIDRNNISLYNDVIHHGNLFSTMTSYIELPETGDTWHIQDDVIISSKFKEQTEQEYDADIVCGFCNRYSDNKPSGKATVNDMWMSFQCIRIPNDIAIKCAEWFYRDVVFSKEHHSWVQQRKYDDTFFKLFIQKYYPQLSVYHVAPNIVDHVDYLIGGSAINQCRGDVNCRSIHWEDEYLVKELEEKLKKCQCGQ